jgi:hypothetical protein
MNNFNVYLLESGTNCAAQKLFLNEHKRFLDSH